LPQVTLPAVALDGCPVGLSVIGPRQADEALLALAAQ
jgi:amidase